MPRHIGVVHPLYPRIWFRAYVAYYLVILLLATAGVWKLARRGAPALQPVWLITAFLLALSGLQSLYYVEGWHRWAIKPMVLAVSGGGILVARRRRLA